jgi:hypothetical protein
MSFAGRAGWALACAGLALAGCQFEVSLDNLQSTAPDASMPRAASNDAAEAQTEPSTPDTGAQAPEASPIEDSSQDASGFADVPSAHADGSGEGAAADASSGFPLSTSSVLDDFGEKNGPIDAKWSGDIASFAVNDGELTVVQDLCDSTIVLGTGAHQLPEEAFFTIDAIPPMAPPTTELDLVLDAQTASHCDLVEISYLPATREVKVEVCASGSWDPSGAPIPLTLDPGDQLGARLDANGTVSVYRNGMLQAERTIAGFATLPHSGHIGLTACDGKGTKLDDFGGTP